MRGETNLNTLLREMQPALDERQFVFCSVDAATYEHLAMVAVGSFREAEGITLILDERQAALYALPYTDVWALITLTVHSDLTAVGFLAVITTKLAGAQISVNPVSGFYHDHLFVPHAERDRAMNLLNEFSLGG